MCQILAIYVRVMKWFMKVSLIGSETFITDLDFRKICVSPFFLHGLLKSEKPMTF